MLRIWKILDVRFLVVIYIEITRVKDATYV